VKLSEVAAKRIARFTSGIKPELVSVALTGGYPLPLARNILLSAVWTFLNPFETDPAIFISLATGNISINLHSFKVVDKHQ
jgi:hypothetical protein